MRTLTGKRFVLLTAVVVLCVFAFTQENKRTLNKEEYAQWQFLRETAISPDGKWIAYHVTLVKEDDTLHIETADSDEHYKFALASRPKFSMDSKWAAFRIGYPEEKIEEMKEKKEKVKYKTGLLNLETGEDEKFDDVKDFEFSETGKFIALHKYKPEKKESKGSDLILRNLITGSDRNIGNVASYAFNDKGDMLAYIIDAEGRSGNGVELFNLKDYTIHILDSDTTSFSQLVWEKEGDALAFLHSFGNPEFEDKSNKVIVFKNIYDNLKKKVYDPKKDKTFPDSMRIFEGFEPVWSEDLSTVFFGIKEWTKKVDEGEGKKDEVKKKEEKKDKGEHTDKLPGVDVWHWKDPHVQPRQKKTYSKDKNFSYLCGWHIDENKFVRITDEEVEEAELTGDQKHAIGKDESPYEPVLKLQMADYYIIDTKTGKRKKILENFYGMYGSSPDGKYVLYFKDKDWWTYDIENDRHINLTEDVDAKFWNTEYDGPRKILPPWGNGGWLEKDERVLLYDRYNIWSFEPEGDKFKTLTNGNKDEIRFRVIKLDDEEDFLDSDEPIFMYAFGDKTKKSGFYRLKWRDNLEELIFEDKRIRGLKKAESEQRYIYTSESYIESPNVFFVNEDFENPKRISDTNPQQKNYLWGKTELINYTNNDGKELQGVIHYPAEFDPDKKYPMLVYIYEIRSDYMHRYIVPSKKSFYNITNYSQQGYFVFQPDIVYKINDPGMSAVDCVVPAVRKVIQDYPVDESRIGIMGHSWGGYQTAFLVTQTDIFSAAVAGAPLIDMISMYNEIYWNTGTPNQIIFETSQGRFDEPFYNITEKFIENSPLFNAKNITTPLLVAFGDEDGAVDWHQGIEMYITMRRLQKPMILLVYADENHSVRKKENMLDYSRRINEFFDHYLKGKKAPEWITKGVPYIEKKKKEEKQKDKKK